MNMWVERGKTITPEKLLGKNFLSKEKQLTEEEYKIQRKQLNEMAIKQRRILGRIKEGKMKTRQTPKTRGR